MWAKHLKFIVVDGPGESSEVTRFSTTAPYGLNHNCVPTRTWIPKNSLVNSVDPGFSCLQPIYEPATSPSLPLHFFKCFERPSHLAESR